MTTALRRVAATVSPAHRRWRRLLAGLTLDPETLPVPLPAPGPRDFLICGSPRTGTALLTAALFQPPRVVTVMEPWDALRLPPAELCAGLRAEIGTGVLRRGRLDVAALQGSGRVAWTRDGERPVPVVADPDHLLGVKLPAFWRYLDLLPATKFVVCLRDPAETVASYAATGGRLVRGLEYDVAFHRRMNAGLLAGTDDDARRRMDLYDHIHTAVLPHLGRPNVLTVRYERWFTEPGTVMAELSDFLEVDLAPPACTITPPAPGRPRPTTAVRSRTAAALGYAP